MPERPLHVLKLVNSYFFISFFPQMTSLLPQHLAELRVKAEISALSIYSLYSCGLYDAFH